MNILTYGESKAVAIYKIADMKIKYETKSTYILKKLQPYIIEDKEYDYEVIVSEDDINYERSLTDESGMDILESAALFRHICKNVLKSYNGIFLHCAALRYNDKAYLFTAPSGTGKTTHIRMWMKNLGDRVEVINGDKPILRKKGDDIIVYGTPWQGKENYGSNISAKLGGIFLLSRGAENSVEKAPVKDLLAFLLSQTLRPNEKEDMIKLFEVLEFIVGNIPIYHLKCNMENQAVQTALSVIDK